jgi:hypothetical protein
MLFREGDRVRFVVAGPHEAPPFQEATFWKYEGGLSWVHLDGKGGDYFYPNGRLALVTPDPSREEEIPRVVRRKPYGFGAPALPTSKSFGH